MNSKNESIQSAIYSIIKAEKGRPIPAGILMEKVKTNLALNDRQLIYNVIDNLILIKRLKKTPSGSIIENYINEALLEEKLQGVVTVNSNLDGYVHIINKNNKGPKIDYFVHSSNLNCALNNDTVEIQLMNKFSKNQTQHAIITKVVESNTKFTVGTFELTGTEYNVVLDDKRNYLKVELQDISKLVNGHKILIQISKYENGIAYGDVVRILGHKDDVGVDIVSIVAAHGIPLEFSKEAVAQAEAYKIDPKDNADIRKDLSDRLIITIDPASSKDLDDAIHVSKLENGNFFLSVSIADVSHYVDKDALYKEAIERGTSVYLVDRVIPMLPHYLSNNICSLNPNEPRLCITCDAEIDAQGRYHNIQVYPSVIKTHTRMSYDEVNEYYDGKAKADWSNELKQMLDTAKELHKVLRVIKYEHGYIDFDIKEPTIIVNEKCWPTEIKIKERGVAQRMIEDFMIAANESVTLRAKELKIPFIYRIHDVPQNEKLKMFAIEAKRLGFMINEKDFDGISPKVLVKWLEQNKDNENIQLISKLLLRCMSKAMYSTKNAGHFGLGSQYYTHFTSPIRRAPDLLIHKLYWMFVFNAKKYEDKDREQFKNELDELCKHCTDTEINALETEREVNQLKFCQYLSDRIKQTFTGVISTIKNFGMFIELEENTIEGLVRISNIGKDFWVYNPETLAITGKKTGQTFNFGQKLEVRVVSVDIPTRQIDLEIVGYEQAPKEAFTPRRENNRSFKKF